MYINTSYEHHSLLKKYRKLTQFTDLKTRLSTQNNQNIT